MRNFLRRGAALALLSGLSGSCATTSNERAGAPPTRFYPEIEARTSGHGFVHRQAYFTEAEVGDPRWELSRRATMGRIRMCRGPYRITRRDVRWYDPNPGDGQRCAAIVYTAFCAGSRMEVPDRMETDRIGALRQDIDGPVGPECGEKDAARQPETSLDLARAENERKWAALLSPSANCEGADTETADPIRVLPQTRIFVRTLLDPAVAAFFPRPHYPQFLTRLPERMNDSFYHANRIVPQVRATPIADDGVNILLTQQVALNGEGEPYCVQLTARQGPRLWRRTIRRPGLVEHLAQEVGVDREGLSRDPSRYWSPQTDGVVLALALGAYLLPHAAPDRDFRRRWR